MLVDLLFHPFDGRDPASLVDLQRNDNRITVRVSLDHDVDLARPQHWITKNFDSVTVTPGAA
jgi:hypothetical protein